MKENKPYFLVIKRQALSKKIEWTAPKGKSEEGENSIETAKREIFEETSIDPELLENKGKLGDFIISFPDSNFKKKVTYFLFKYNGDSSDVKISNTEGYVGVYNWLPIEKIINLVEYQTLRELYRKGYQQILNNEENSETNKNTLNLIMLPTDI